MRTLITLVIVMTCLQLWAQVPDTTSVAPGRLIIKVNQAFQTINTRSDGIIETEQTWFNTLAIQYQIDELRQMYVGSTRTYAQNKYVICFPESLDLETVASNFEQQNSVQDVRYDFYVHLCTDDTFNSYQWNLQRINANASYYALVGSIQAPQAVRIAVVDTGIDYNHPDLSNSILRDQNNNIIGTNVVFPGQPAMDDNGHGTLMAGIIAAQTNNNAGISSLVIGNNVKLMPIKAFNRFQQGWVSDVCSGIDWATNLVDNNGVDIGANIINCSWVTYEDDDIVPNELWDIIVANPNVLFVAARGSYLPGQPFITFQASWANGTQTPNVIAVSGSNYNNVMAYDGGEFVTICAPSGTTIQDPQWAYHDPLRGIVSTLPINNQTTPYQMHYSNADQAYSTFHFGDWLEENSIYDFFTGTSISAAQVSGLVGMLWAQNYNEIDTPAEIYELKNIIKKSSQEFNNFNHYYTDGYHGGGIINAHEALMAPHPNLSMREYQVGAQTFSYPINPLTLPQDMPSMVWGSSKSFRVKVHNKWEAGTNISIHLSSTDPNISFSYPNGIDHYVIGSIGAETDHWTSNMYIIDNSTRARLNVPIAVKISVAGVPDRDYTITINVLQNTNVTASIIELFPNETITTDIVVNDIDGNNNNEIFVGTSAGRLFCYRNGLWQLITTLLSYGILINPSIGDINGDGQKEIVVIDTAGNIRIFNNMFNLSRSYPCFSNETTIGSIVLEDVTDDNILDIIYSTNHGTGSFVRVIDFANNSQHEFSKDKNIVAALAVGDANHLPGHEIIVSYLHIVTYGITRNLLGFSVLNLNSSSQLTELSFIGTLQDINTVLDPKIVDINEDGKREIVWMLNYNNTSTRYIYSLILNAEFNSQFLSFTTSNYSEVGKVIENSNNIATIYSYTSASIPSVSIISGFEYDQDYYSATIFPNAQVKRFVVDNLFPVASGYSSQQLVLMTDHILAFYKISENPNPPNLATSEIWEYKTDYGSNVNIVSMVTSQRNTSRVLSVITDNGVVYEYYFTKPINHTASNPQQRQTSRHTGCYEQPIPKTMNNSLHIKHPFVVDESVSAYATLTIDEGVVGRLQAGRSIAMFRSDLVVSGSDDNPVIFKGLGGGSDNDYWGGIYVTNGSDLDMNWAEISGAYQALDISNTGNRFIKNSKFFNNFQNVNCFNASVNMYYNFLTDAIHSISAYHYASPMLSNTVIFRNGLNEIIRNEYGIFSDSSTPVLADGHNNLEVNDRYNLYLQNLPLMSGPIQAKNNWWGSTDYREVEATINMPNRVEFYPYDLRPNQTLVRENQSSSMFDDGYAYMLNGEYLNAINCFNNVLADSLINDSDIVSLYAMFECYKQLGEISVFETQLDQYILASDYSLLHLPMKNIRALIYRETERFTQAINHYENILMNNPAFQDSCYAVIDLGDTYLESNGSYRGQLSEYVPTSSIVHQQTRDTLLRSISQLYETDGLSNTAPQLMLLGNYPNPFNPTTTIRFQMKTDSNVKIEIYNIKGQKVSTILNENRLAGLNSVVWNGKDSRNVSVASGVYFYRVECDGSKKTAKMLLLK